MIGLIWGSCSGIVLALFVGELVRNYRMGVSFYLTDLLTWIMLILISPVSLVLYVLLRGIELGAWDICLLHGKNIEIEIK
jgi:hypothetical protein